MTRIVTTVSLLFCLHSMAIGQFALAETVFVDSFRDGNAQDGNPVTWNAVGSNRTSFEVVDESLIFGLDAAGSGLVGNRADADGISLLDVSIRTQLRLSGNGRAGVFGRGLSATITSEGGANFFGIPDIATGLNPLSEDVVIQLDAIGPTAKMWVWRAGERMPITPLATASTGRGTMPVPVSIAVQANPDAMASAEFRYVAVASSSIPEPSAAALVMLGGLGCLHTRLRLKRSLR